MSNSIDHFLTELDLQINRFRQEYEMTYAELIGCLEIKKSEILQEMQEDEDEDEDE
jgi:hypothetical protein